MGFEWTDLSYQEAKVGRTGYYIFALSVLFVPVFYVVVRRWFKGSERQRRKYAHEDDTAPGAGAGAAAGDKGAR